jgi:hypothetical protein
MKQRTLFIVPWAIVACIIAGGICIPADIFGSGKGWSVGVIFWTGWLSCRLRDWIIKRADQIKEIEKP